MRSLAFEAFGGLTCRLVWLGLLNGLWLGLLTASACALLFRTAPRLSHRMRYAVLFSAMLLVATGPLAVSAAQQFVRTRPVTGGPSETESQLVVIAGSATSGIPSTSISGLPQPEPALARSWHLRFPEVALARAVDFALELQPIIVLAWLVVVASLSALLILGARGTRRLCRTALPAPEFIEERRRRLGRRLRLRRIPRVLIHPGIAEPCLCGVNRPVILIPGPWIADVAPERLDAILAHELAHARRLDPLVNLFQRLVESWLFFHPAVHWLSRSLRRERELCTDALAIRLTRNPMALAEALESVARLRLQSRSAGQLPIAGTSLGGHRNSLLPRIQELIGMMPARPRVPVWSFAALPAAGLVALVASAVGMADDRPSGSPRPESASVGGAPQSQVTPSTDTKAGPRHQVFASQAIYSDRQISLEVRYFAGLDANSWRNRFDDRLKPIQQDDGVTAWIIDDKAFLELLNLAQSDTVVNMLLAPKVTTFENSKATILNLDKQHYVSGFEKFESTGDMALKPIVKEVEIGYRVELTGSFLPQGTRLDVDLHNSSLLSMHTLFRQGHFRNGDVNATYQVPETMDRRLHVSCDVTDESYLVISVGLEEQSRQLGRAAEFASGFMETVGLPSLKARSTTRERLVVIKPRKIILESEEHPVSSIDRAHPLRRKPSERRAGLPTRRTQ